MQVGERERFCDLCHCSVHNLSALKAKELAHVVKRSASESICISYVRRRDGSMVTRWELRFEHWLAPFRRGFAWALALLAPWAFGGCQTNGPLISKAEPVCTTRPVESSPSSFQEPDRMVVTGGIPINPYRYLDND